MSPGRALFVAVVVGCVLHTSTAGFFDEYRKQFKQSTRSNGGGSKDRGGGHARDSNIKLPQTKESVDHRRKRIDSSLKLLDELLQSEEIKKHSVSRNKTVDVDYMTSSEMRSHVYSLANVSENERGGESEEDLEVNFLEVNTKFVGGAVAGAALNMLFSRTTMCVMCSYILEMADRQVKASPRWANGGGGFFPGQVDFSPGENQGFYRTYPGGYLETEEKIRAKAPIGSGKPEPAAMTRIPSMTSSPSLLGRLNPSSIKSGTDMSSMRMQSESVDVHKSQSPPRVEYGAHPKAAYSYKNAVNMYGMGTNNNVIDGLDKTRQSQAMKHMRVGRFTPRDFDRVDAQSEKSMEYQQMFDDLMDAFDKICFEDLPASYSQYCNLIYHNGEALAEYYLHDYEDWEICTKIFECIDGFYDGL
eukprot:g670.t1